MDTTTLMTSLFLGAFGMGFLAYARRQRDPVSLFTGVALCVVPYFLHGVILSIGVGVALVALPFVLRRMA